MTNQLKYYIHRPGILITTGKDRIDFFNRMSTNDLSKITAGSYLKTSFTSDKGRIIAFVTIINFENKSFIILPKDQTEYFKNHLEKYIITEDVVIDDLKKDIFKVSIISDKPIEASELIFKTPILNGNSVSNISKNTCAFADDFGLKFLNIITTEDELSIYEEALKDACRLDDVEFAKIKIENFIPSFPGELNDEINPVEIGLSSFISYSKGCYIGQEVISRLDAQRKIPKQLVRIETDLPVERGDRIISITRSEEHDCGFISTSVSGYNKALGFIRSVDLKPGNAYVVLSGIKRIPVRLHLSEKNKFIN